MRLYEYVGCVSIVKLRPNQADKYGFIPQADIDRLPRITLEDNELIERMEDLLKVHNDFMAELAKNAAQEAVNKQDEKDRKKKKKKKKKKKLVRKRGINKGLKTNKKQGGLGDKDDCADGRESGGGDDDDEDDDDNNEANNNVDSNNGNNIVPGRRKINKKGAGRKVNGIFPFDIRHPYFGTHVQVLRSKLLIPTIFGAIPRLPAVLGEHTRAAQAKVALFMLTLFKPWDIETGVPCADISWESFLEYLCYLVSPETSDCTSDAVIFIINNILECCRVSTTKRTAANLWRKNQVITWTRAHQFAKLQNNYIEEFYKEVRRQVALLKEEDREKFDNYEDIIPTYEDLQSSHKNATEEGFQMDNLGEFSMSDANDEEVKLTQDTMDAFMFDIMQQNTAFSNGDNQDLGKGKSEALQYVQQSISLYKQMYQCIFDDAEAFKMVKEKLGIYAQRGGDNQSEVADSVKSIIIDINSFKQTLPSGKFIIL
jgi:hypothetical protein